MRLLQIRRVFTDQEVPFETHDDEEVIQIDNPGGNDFYVYLAREVDPE